MGAASRASATDNMRHHFREQAMASRFESAAIVLALSICACAAYADDRSDYNRRAAARDIALFQELDRNGDGVLARDESRADLDLGPRFDDIDINRDGIVTPAELQRYIAQRYDVQADMPSASAAAGR
jgi:hypothetical protein